MSGHTVRLNAVACGHMRPAAAVAIVLDLTDLDTALDQPIPSSFEIGGDAVEVAWVGDLIRRRRRYKGRRFGSGGNEILEVMSLNMGECRCA